MYSKEPHKKIIYSQLVKYLKRSMQGDDFATNLLERILDSVNSIDENIYQNAMMDVVSSISEVDDRYLGKSLTGLIRAEYSDYNELDEFFALYSPKGTENKFTFDDFCISFGYNPKDIVLFPITGNSMIGAGINDGDVAVVNLNLRPQKGDIAAININQNYFIKRIGSQGGSVVLISENPDYEPYKVTIDDDFRYIGTVTNIMKSIITD